MSVFRWTAPVFKWYARYLRQEDFRLIAGWLRPYVPPAGVFADLGGGTGDIGLGVAEELQASVVVVDSTAQMLKRVSAHPSVSVRLASVEALPFPSAAFDAVLCCDAFHHFRDQSAAAGEIARILRPGGGVVILDAEGRGAFRLVLLLERCLGEPAHLIAADALAELFAVHGFTGSIDRLTGSSYAFHGRLAPSSASTFF